MDTPRPHKLVTGRLQETGSKLNATSSGRKLNTWAMSSCLKVQVWSWLELFWSSLLFGMFERCINSWECLVLPVDPSVCPDCQTPNINSLGRMPSLSGQITAKQHYHNLPNHQYCSIHALIRHSYWKQVPVGRVLGSSMTTTRPIQLPTQGRWNVSD